MTISKISMRMMMMTLTSENHSMRRDNKCDYLK